MGIALVKNNAYSTLAANITAGQTTLTVAAGEGARFPTASASSVSTVSYARDATNIATIVTSAAHNFQTGMFVTISGFTSATGQTFNATSVPVTVLTATTFAYFNVGAPVSTTSDATGTALAGSNFFYLTLIDVSNNLEVVKVTAVATDTFTIERAQDGSTARAYTAGDRVELRPVAGLFNDKASLGGGTFTGPIEVPAGASGAQVPRANETVVTSGATPMTGALTVPELRGPSNLITVTSGHRIAAAAAGGITGPGMIIQSAYLRSDLRTSYTVPNSDAGVEIAELTLSITPKYSTSKILLWYTLSGNVNDTDMVLFLTRNGTVIGRNSNSTARWSGLTAGFSTTGGTLFTQTFFYLDTPTSTSALEYKLIGRAAQSTSVTLYLNRTQAGSGSDTEEIGISQVLIQEMGQ